MHKINYNPDDKTLREFAEFGTFLMGLVVAPYMLYEGNTRTAIGFWAAAVVLRVAAFVNLRWMKWPFVGMSVLFAPIGWVVSHLALAIIYYLIITPVALVFRLMGRDALHRKIDRQADTYWEAYNPDRGPARYLRQF